MCIVVFQVTNNNVDDSMRVGVSHGAFNDEIEAMTRVREFIRFLPQNNLEPGPILQSADPVNRKDATLDTIIPWNGNKAYDVRDIVQTIIDDRRFFELQPDFACNIVIGFGRLAGHTIGFVCNQPNVSSGVLDIDASCKAARFVRFCDSFNIPIVTLVDVPGFLPGKTQEHAGIIKHGAKLLHAYAEATIPLLTVILRKAYGGAYDVMSSRHLGAHRVYAWPSAEIAVMGSAGASNIVKEHPLETGVMAAASKGHIDAIIQPHTTRSRLIRDLEYLSTMTRQSNSKKHGNIPL